MNNLKRRILSFALATSVVLSSTGMAFAGNLSAADKLAALSNLGVITGEGNGVIGTQTMTRYRAFVMQIKMMGKYEEMNNFDWEGKETFKDINESHSKFIRKLAAYLKAHPEFGIAGDQFGNLNPMDPVSGREYMKIMLVRLGYVENVDFTWSSIPLFAVSKGIADSAAEVEARNIQVSTIADFTYDALTKTPVNGSVSLGEQLGYVVTPVITLDAVDTTTEDEVVTISGSINKAAAVTVNGKQVTVSGNEFSADVELSLGQNAIKVVAVDAAGARDEETVNVVREYKDLKVLDVEGLNLKQFTIQFSRELDEDTVSNARLGLGANDVYKISEDGKSVLVTLDTPLRQTTDTDYTIKDLKDTDGNKIAKTDITVNVFDNELPEVEDVTVKGNQSITIKFSEPVVDADDLGSYKLDDSLVRGSVDVNDSNTEFTINFKNALEAGDHVLSINSDIEDAAGFNLKAVDIDFTVDEDKYAPDADIISASQTKVVVEFDEEIQGLDKSDISWKSGSKKGYADSVTQDTDNNLRYEITFASGNYLPLNGATLTIKDAKDFSGNVAEEINLDVTPEADLVRPEVTDVETDEDNQNVLYVTFSEDVSDTNGRYILIDEDNKETSAVSKEYAEADKHNRIKVTFSSIDAGDYTLDVSEVTDLSAMENELLPTLEDVTIEDLGRVSVDSYNMVGTGEDMRILVKYSEAVDETTATDIDNYKYRIGGLFYDLPEDADITLLNDDKTVEIAFPTEWSVNGSDYTLASNYSDIISVQVENVTDEAGNEIYAVSLDLTADGGLSLATEAPEVESVAVTGENTLELTLNHPINESTIDRDDFIVKLATGETLNVYSVEYSDTDDNYKLTLYVREDLDQNGQFDATALQLELANSVSTENIYGSTLTLLHGAANISVDDAYVPEATVTDAVYGTETQITFEVGEVVQFGTSTTTTSETVDGVTTVTLQSGTAANDLLISRFTVNKGSDELAIDKIQIVDGTKLVFVINDGSEDWDGQELDVTLDALDDAAYSITDLSGNILKNFDNVDVSIENIN